MYIALRDLAWSRDGLSDKISKSLRRSCADHSPDSLHIGKRERDSWFVAMIDRAQTIVNASLGPPESSQVDLNDVPSHDSD